MENFSVTLYIQLVFQRFEWDIVSAVSWFPRPALAFFVADPVAVKVSCVNLHSRW